MLLHDDGATESGYYVVHIDEANVWQEVRIRLWDIVFKYNFDISSMYNVVLRNPWNYSAGVGYAEDVLPAGATLEVAGMQITSGKPVAKAAGEDNPGGSPGTGVALPAAALLLCAVSGGAAAVSLRRSRKK